MKHFFFLFFAILFFIPSAAYAQDNGVASAPAFTASEKVSILPVPPDKPTNLFGQNQSYTLTLRGNGEAVVTFKAIFSNTGTTPLSTVSLQLPENVSPADIIAYQVIQEPQCIRYIPQNIPAVKVQNPPAPYQEVCAEYQQPNYQYVYGNTKYQRIQNETQNNTVLLRLPTPIEPDKNGSYFIYYRTKAITTKDLFGAYDYKFVTLKTEDKIQSLQIGISTDADYILRGAKADVNYAASTTMAALPIAADGAQREMSNPQLDQFYNQIGSGTIVKQATELAPLETYEVKGLYADSQAKLYGKEIATGAGILLFLALLLVITAKITLKRLSGKKTDKPEEAVVQLKNRNKTFLISLSVSFVSMLLVCLYTFGIYAVTQLLMNPYGYSGNDGILALFVLAVSALVYLFFFFTPSVAMGLKKGLGWALVTFSATVVWSILFLLVLFVLLFFFTPRDNGYPKPYPMMNVMEGRAAPAMDLVAPAPAAVMEPASEPQSTESKPVEIQTVQPQTIKLERVETKIAE